ncbi:MAG: hypothetical protein HXY26_11295 [Hydrogenophilaceae bacterium]|nr:hypothetical protein [Hydrogenophilaceae bacterium]
MNRLTKMLLLGLLGAAVAGCAVELPTKQTSEAATERTINAGQEPILKALLGFFAQHNVHVAGVDRELGLVRATGIRVPEAWADCGGPGIFMLTNRRVELSVLINKQPDGKSRVSVSTNFMADLAYRDGPLISPRVCYSSGQFEAMLFDHLEKNAK